MMKYYYADVMSDGQVRACFCYEGPDEGPLEPHWESQAEGSPVLLDGPIDWRGPSDTSVLYMADGVLEWRESLPLADVVARAVAQVDVAADAARLAVSPAGRDLEYQRAEVQARTFKDAGYIGDVPPCVDSWARAKQWAAEDAANDILATAARWYAALDGIRDLRLNAKENARRAQLPSDVAAIASQFSTDLSNLMKGLA